MKMKFVKVVAATAALVLAVSMSACGNGGTGSDTGSTGSTGSTDTAAEQLNVSMVTDVGGVNDQSFNQSAWEGLQRAEKEVGVKAGFMESKQDADYIPNIETLIDQKADLICAIGYKMGDAVAQMAESYPDQKFAIVDFAYDPAIPNVAGIVFSDHESSFLVGYIAGKMTEANKVGFVGGMEGDVISRFHYGYMAGVNYANPDAEIVVQYANDFADAAKGKAIANQMYTDGCDIIFVAAGDTGVGVIDAAKEGGKYVIGVDRDQNYLAPDNVITSAIKRVDNALFNVTKDLKDGKAPVGTTTAYGLANGGVGIAPTSDKHVPADILTEIEDIQKKIIDGSIKVPGNESEYESFGN